MSERTIYALLCPVEGTVRYVGQTIQNIEERFNQHLRDSVNFKKSASRTHTGCWIRRLKEDELRPTLHTFTKTDMKNIDAAEVYWIAYFKSIGCKLTNHETGGNKCKRLNASTKKKLSLAKTQTHCKNGHAFSTDNTYKV